MPHIRDLAHSLDWAWALDWESNQQPSGSQGGSQSTEPHQPGLKKYIYLFIFREKGKEGEKHRYVREAIDQLAASRLCPNLGLGYNPGMCPDWEFNRQPFTLWNNAQLTGPHRLEQ